MSIISYITFLSIFIINTVAWNIDFSKNNDNNTYSVYMGEQITLHFNLTDETNKNGQLSLEILSENENIAAFDNNFASKLNINITSSDGQANSSFPLHGMFLGRTRLILTLSPEDGPSEELPPLLIKVTRKQRSIDVAFSGSVATLVTLIYINFGCALDWDNLKTIIKRPIGPLIGFLGQFGVMPTLAYVIGLLVFSEYPEMRLGLLFTGVSPAGGASNIWTYILGGNLELSVTMTTLSTIAAFVMMPLWLFTLGVHVFAEAQIGIPYKHIGFLAAALVVPLLIGWLIRRKLPKLAQILVRILKGFSALLILFIIIFAIATNLYLFRLATWKIAIAGLLLPWLGYLLGGALAKLCKQPLADVTAIAIETGVQNTGIAIFLLRFALPQPEGDLTTVVPVAIAIMTPIPLTCLYIFKRIFRRNENTLNIAETSELTP